ncbi:MAG: DNA-protecting protein DprA, partial [Lachnospiraceae bacterium]
KDVYALPGMITNVLSQGCNELIAQGAGILLSPEELVKELEVAWANRNFKESKLCAKKVEKLLKKEIMLESTEKLLYSCLGQEQKNLNQLIHELGLPAQVLMEQMISLEMKGLVQEITKNYYVRI